MKDQRGFTLIEVLLATLLLASALAVTAASVHGIARAQQRSEALLAISSERNAVQAWLRARIAAAMPVAFDTVEGARVQFIGTRERIEFVTELPPYPTLSGPMRQLVEVQPNAGAGQLLCVTQTTLQAATGLRCEADEQTILASGLARVAFRYRGRDVDGRAGPWMPEWKRTDVLPEWVEVQMDAPAGEAAWPLLTVRIPVAVNPAP